MIDHPMHHRSSRRRFLGSAALSLASGAGLTSILSSPAAARATSSGALTEALAQAAEQSGGREFWPAIVVGTGYGGAVSALRLAESGQEVLMLEMGRSWAPTAPGARPFCSTLAPDGRAMWFKSRTEAPLESFLFLDVINRKIPRYAGVLDRVHLGDMSVFAGRGVGGGSLVNGGMAVTPRRDYLGSQMPQLDMAAMYGRYFPRAQAALRVNRISDAYLARSNAYKFARVAGRQAEAAGFRTIVIPQVYDMAYMEREERGTASRSALRQEVIYGNNHGKASLDKTYLAEALGTGRVTVQVLTRVTGIRREPDGTYVVGITQIDDRGRVLARREVGCGKLVLAAGSLGSTELLLRARDTGTLPDLAPEIGGGWGNNGNVMTARSAGTATGSLQSTMPVTAIDHWDAPKDPALIEVTPLPTGFENGTSMHLAVTKNPERATLSYDAATDGVALDWHASQGAASVRALRQVTDAINRRFKTTYRSDLFGGGRIWGDHFCYHPLGGCVLGQATDAHGRLRGHPGLYVNDGALIPGSVGVNPFVTITALAERNAEEAIVADALRTVQRLRPMPAHIRLADPARDAAACAAIYAHYVTDSVATFETEPPTAADFERRIAATHRWLVAEDDGRVVGYAYASTHNERAAYRWSVNVSVFLEPGHQGQGLGRALYEELLPWLRAAGYRSAIAGITQPNPASAALHRALGFEPVGTYRGIGFKDGRWLDVEWLQLALRPGDDGPPEEPAAP